MNLSTSHVPIGERALTGALAGMVGGLAHAAVNEIDRPLFRHTADDLLVHGGLVSGNRTAARAIGLGVHLGFSALFGATFALVCKPATPSESFNQAIGFAMAEHIGLYPLSIAMDRLHPYIRDGRMDPFWHKKGFAQATLRHLALGIGLGLAFPPISARIRARGI